MRFGKHSHHPHHRRSKIDTTKALVEDADDDQPTTSVPTPRPQVQDTPTSEGSSTAVRVFCRVRPPKTTEEIANNNPFEIANLPSCIQYSSQNLEREITSIRVDMLLEKSKKRKPQEPTQTRYKFTSVFPPSVSQRDVFAKVCDGIPEALFGGINAAILACGQTGSGKTHTMMGPPEAPDSSGIIPRLLDRVFDIASSQFGQTATITASFFEIYFERVFDLLSPARRNIPPAQLETFLMSSPGLTILQGKQGDLLVRDGIRVPITSAREALEVFELGRAVRMAGSTKSNLYSSRSHAIFLLTTQVRDSANSGNEFISQLYLCDLAGSERVSRTETQGMRLQEAGHINHSILTLGKVIAALAEGEGRDKSTISIAPNSNDDSDTSYQQQAQHVPYRDSKLTRFLVNALGGNGICSLLMCVSPDGADSCETDATLQLGARSQSIKNVVKVNSCRSVEELERCLDQANNTINTQLTTIQAQQREIEQLTSLVQQLHNALYVASRVPNGVSTSSQAQWDSLLQSSAAVVVQKNTVTMAAPAQPAPRMNLALLPFDIRLHILSFLDGQSLYRTRSVCRNLHVAARNDQLWEGVWKAEHNEPKPEQASYFHAWLRIEQRRGRATAAYDVAQRIGTTLPGVFLLRQRSQQ